MADEIDRAQEGQAEFNHAALLRHRANREQLTGNGICVDCDEAIEKKRLMVCKGTLRCRDCQSKHEDRKKRQGAGE
jgi:phage/conjugal plasmid C-4 type zinc finger TraR family protein